jgi:hypothetical protein
LVRAELQGEPQDELAERAWTPALALEQVLPPDVTVALVLLPDAFAVLAGRVPDVLLAWLLVAPRAELPVSPRVWLRAWPPVLLPDLFRDALPEAGFSPQRLGELPARGGCPCRPATAGLLQTLPVCRG